MNITRQKNEIEGLEKAFWDSIVQGKPEVATRMLAEPAVMVSPQGTNKFDHAAYRKMAKDDRYRLTNYKISDLDVIFPREDVAVATYYVDQQMEMQGKPTKQNVYDTSTWVKVDGNWLCVLHTESPAEQKRH
ncbi:nuclear transport factor 2 family protein [Pseudoxanthomonas gei]|uniref:Nuclear transport factor 2 family protein n=1 Tax=Pseudoxanthomonas gei TaxID=1383030 RepID=A0ABX0AA97_9GAMM|nr:nuclear transport factor 2 family protein [Pseudoxanthomonas gei]NDK38464.1 nuclear transport factor 2 family protein [Pseudoxanthomonas gei]